MSAKNAFCESISKLFIFKTDRQSQNNIKKTEQYIHSNRQANPHSEEEEESESESEDDSFSCSDTCNSGIGILCLLNKFAY